MGVRFPSVASSTFIGPLPASAAETIILTTPPISEPVDNALVNLFWCANILAGTGTTALVFRIRRGATLTGAVVGAGPWTHTLAAAASGILSWADFDGPGVVAGQQYTLTISQTGATGAGTFNDGTLVAMIL